MSQEFDEFDCAIATALTQVKMYAHPDLPDAISVVELSLPKCKVFICVEEEYDTLLCSNILPKSHSECTIRLSSSFWDPLLGKVLTNAWRMTNDRGYPDAIQLRFRQQVNAGPYTVLQMYAEASQIVLTELAVTRDAKKL